MTAQDALHYVATHTQDYIRMARLTGAGAYPLDNRCARCEQVADRPLVPWSVGWLCSGCTYGRDGAISTLTTQPDGASCCSGGPLRLKCQLCSQSPTYWRAAS